MNIYNYMNPWDIQIFWILDTSKPQIPWLSLVYCFFAVSVAVHKYGNGISYTAIFTILEITEIAGENSAENFLCSNLKRRNYKNHKLLTFVN